MIDRKDLNNISLTQFPATIAKAMGIEPPMQAAPPVDWVCAALENYCKDGFDRLFIHNPDSVGMWVTEKYHDAIAPVMKHTQLAVPFQTVMPSVTPVCFASMYTGADPEIHGIRKYEKPIVQTDCLLDALLRAGKKVAMIADEKCSMGNIFKDRPIDFYYMPPGWEGANVDKAEELILKDEYDAIILYTWRYDTNDHKFGPEAPESIAALYAQGQFFDRLVSTIRRCWTKHNTLVSFSPDHGCHAIPDHPEKPGNHGSDCAQDLNILHFIGAIKAKDAE